MGYKCVVCKIGYAAADSKISLHKFPKDEYLKKIWLDACGIKKILPSHRICDKHFAKDCFYENGYLLRKAVPFLSQTKSSNIMNVSGGGCKMKLSYDNMVPSENVFQYPKHVKTTNVDKSNQFLPLEIIDNPIMVFPKDGVRKKLWLKACKIRFHLPSHKVCKDHFLAEHYLPSGYLKGNAIPFIEPASKDTEFSNPTSPAMNLGVKPIVSTGTTGIEPADHTYYRTSSPCQNPIENLCVESIASTTTNIKPSDLCDTSNPSPIIQKRRNKINANTIGELSPSHFSSPEKVKKHLDLVKAKFREKQVENSNLKKLIKRLKKKLIAYESVIR